MQPATSRAADLANSLAGEAANEIWELWLAASKTSYVIDQCIATTEPAYLAKHVFQLGAAVQHVLPSPSHPQRTGRNAEEISAGDGCRGPPRNDSLPGGYGHHGAASHVEYVPLRRASGRAACLVFMHNVAAPSAPSHSWPRRIILGLLVLMLFFAVAGMIYENIFEARDRRFNPMTGRLVRRGRIPDAHRLHGRGKSHGDSRVRPGRYLCLLAQGAAADREIRSRLLLRSRRTRLQRFQSATSHQPSHRRRTARVAASRRRRAALCSRRPFHGRIRCAALRQPVSQ